MKISRRFVLRGLGGAVVTLPVLHSLGGPDHARAGVEPMYSDDTFAIFFRQANGVATANGDEPERFWPNADGALTPETMAGRAVEELVDHRDQLLMIRNVNYEYYDFGDGHANGAMQALTARGPLVAGQAGDSEASGESIDHRLGVELNPAGRESLVMYAGSSGGWLGGPCIAYRGPGERRTALHNPWNAYVSVFGEPTEGGMTDPATVQIAQRRRSVNDLVRSQLRRILNRPELSAVDRRRIDLHLSAIRDLEVALTCRLSEDAERELEGAAPGYDSSNGDDTLETARLHMRIAALAVACGHTRSASIQIGVGNDGNTRYRNLDTGELMENYHYLSHRRNSHGDDGSLIAEYALLHHHVDRQFAQTFRYLLDQLAGYDMGDGTNLLSKGVAIWYNDNANGPPHGSKGVPWILAGSCNGVLRQGQVVRLSGGDSTNLAQVHNSIATACGVPMNDFGDSDGPRGTRDELFA